MPPITAAETAPNSTFAIARLSHMNQVRMIEALQVAFKHTFLLVSHRSVSHEASNVYSIVTEFNTSQVRLDEV